MRRIIKMRNLLFTFGIILTVLLAGSCTIDKNEITEPTIYFGGYYTPTNKNIKADSDGGDKYMTCYWQMKNNKLTRKDIVDVYQDAVDLRPWIYIKNGVVYYPGEKTYYDSLNDYYYSHAYYFQINSDGIISEHKISDNDSEANYVMIDKNDKIYVAGVLNDQACYWKIDNGQVTPYTFNDGSDAIYLNVYDNRVFVVGRETTDDAQYAHYWITENGQTIKTQRINPDNSESSTCIGSYIYKNKLYIAGDYLDNGSGIRHACYWVVNTDTLNLEKTITLPDKESGEDSFALNIFVDKDGNIYIVGISSENHPCYWADDGNNITQYIIDKNLDGLGTAIWVKNNKIYISGQYCPDNDPDSEVELGCYWVIENGNIVKNSLEEDNAVISSIFVE